MHTMNLSEAIELFLDQYKKTTRKAYASALIPMREWVGPARPVDSISDLDMLRYTNQIRQAGYAPATVRKHLKSLKTFFNWLVRRGWLPSSPVADVRNITVDEYIGRDKAMSDQQFDQLIRFMERNQRRYVRQLALIRFLGDTGCRAAGAAGLRWADVDFATGTAYVTEKGDRTRPAFFFELASFALRDWQDHQQPVRGDHVFGYRGDRITSASLQQLFRRTCQDAGVGSLGPHTLRHRKAHQLVDAGVGASIAATVIGDTAETFIRHYAPRDFASAKEAARQVSQRPTADGKIITVRQDKRSS